MLTGKKSYTQKLRAIFGSSLIGLWSLDESSGTVAYDRSGNARNGAYTAVTLANAKGPTKTCTMAPLFDGSTSFCNVYSAGFAGAFNGALGSVLLWGKVLNVGVWTDSTTRMLSRFMVDNNNYMDLRTTGASGYLQYLRAGNNIADGGPYATGSPTNWFQAVITWSETADELKTFFNGTPALATQATLGAWSGSLSATKVCLGAASTVPGNVWSGWLAHIAVLNRVATPAEVQSVYSWGL